MRVLKWTGVAVGALLLALVLFVAFGLNALKGPITKRVTEATGRALVIEGDLRAVWSWLHPTFRAERVRFANAPWGRAEPMFRAEAVEASISVLALLAGRVVIPGVHVERGELSLEQTADGRRNWVLQDKAEEESRVRIQHLTLDDGLLHYVDAGRGIDLTADLATDPTGVHFQVAGRYGESPLKAAGHAGHVLSLRDASTPFPLAGTLKVGPTELSVDGTLTGIVGLERIDTKLELSGRSLDELYDLIGVALPGTNPYRTRGRLVREKDLVRYEDFTAKVGRSDLAGVIEVSTAGRRPFMKGDLRAKVLNLGDLGPLVGADRAPKKKRQNGVLPDAPFSPDRWDSVDADVSISAGRIDRPEQLPIEKLGVRIRMKDRVLTLDPLDFGIAGGRLAGPVRLDGTKDTIRAEVKMRIDGLQLGRLFPTIEQNRTSVGTLSGLIELAGTGNSVSRMLGSANGAIGAYMDGGRISRFMMELVALDLWDVAKVKLQGDEPIEIRCAIADFGVKKGVMSTNAFVFDTSVVLVEGGGTINLQSEAMDFKLDPKPKDSSVASLNSPLFVQGTFGDPKVSPDVGKLAAKGLGAIVMGIINPVLAVLPLFKEASGEDSNCAALLSNSSAGASRRRSR